MPAAFEDGDCFGFAERSLNKWAESDADAGGVLVSRALPAVAEGAAAVCVATVRGAGALDIVCGDGTLRVVFAPLSLLEERGASVEVELPPLPSRCRSSALDPDTLRPRDRSSSFNCNTVQPSCGLLAEYALDTNVNGVRSGSLLLHVRCEDLKPWQLAIHRPNRNITSAVPATLAERLLPFGGGGILTSIWTIVRLLSA